ncbi:MAG: hypothetical protein AVDCRST_MAG10-2051, partial [uncultured Acidimicrobiales bacterium]
VLSCLPLEPVGRNRSARPRPEGHHALLLRLREPLVGPGWRAPDAPFGAAVGGHEV